MPLYTIPAYDLAFSILHGLSRLTILEQIDTAASIEHSPSTRTTILFWPDPRNRGGMNRLQITIPKSTTPSTPATPATLVSMTVTNYDDAILFDGQTIFPDWLLKIFNNLATPD